MSTALIWISARQWTAAIKFCIKLLTERCLRTKPIPRAFVTDYGRIFGPFDFDNLSKTHFPLAVTLFRRVARRSTLGLRKDVFWLASMKQNGARFVDTSMFWEAYIAVESLIR